MAGLPTTRSRRKWWWIPLLLTVGAGVLLWSLLGKGPVNPGAETAGDLDRIHPVTRGDFPITILLSGSLDAIKRHALACEIRGNYQLKFEMILDDRTAVKKDDVVAIFAREDFVKELDSIVLRLDDERKNLILAEQDLVIRDQANLISIQRAREELKSAAEAQERYENLDAPKQRNDLLTALSAAAEGTEIARRALFDAESAVAELGMDSSQKMESAQQALTLALRTFASAEAGHEKAQHELRVFRQYDYPKKIRTLKEGRSIARLGVQKALVETRSSMIKAETTLQNIRLRLRQNELMLAELKEKIEKLVIRAPVGGILAHGDPNRPQYRQPDEVKVGAVTQPYRPFASIPDLSRFVVKVDVPESQRSNLRLGLKALLRTPALPRLKMEGTVSEIAPLAQNVIAWDKNSPKVYETKIATEIQHPSLMPGMTIEVEIVVETVTGALFVPVESLYNREGKVYCRLSTLGGSKEVEVEAGRSSSSYVEILKGLDEGDQVLLYRRDDAEGKPK